MAKYTSDELYEIVKEGIANVFESENYKNFLTKMALFHDYSINNTFLILRQKPEATLVAGFSAWKNNFNRSVQKGEKGIAIIGYREKRVTVKETILDDQGKPKLDENGKAQTKDVQRKYPVFTPVYVFDVSQTEGEPLPKLVNELTGDVQAYEALKNALIKAAPFPVTFEAISGEAKGYCDYINQKIAVKDGMSESQTIKTLIHEITHADLHAPELNYSIEEKTDRATREIEAESTAFVVCSHYGIDTSDYSFPYLASWTKSKELDSLKSSLETISDQAEILITKIDRELSDLTLQKEEVNIMADIPTKFEDKAVYFEEKAKDLAIKYDALIDSIPDANKSLHLAHPFTVNEKDKRIEILAKRISNYDVSGMNTIANSMIQSFSTTTSVSNESMVLNIENQFSNIMLEYEAFRQEKLTYEVEKYGGEPVVSVNWSESPELKPGETFPLHKADELFRRLDTNYPENQGYDKTSFCLKYMQDGTMHVYNGRQDFGDREGGVVDHIQRFWEYEASPKMTEYHISSGNEHFVEQAKEAVNNFVPYLKMHNNLGALEASVKDQLKNTLPEADQPYYKALLDYVKDCRTALNTNQELPLQPEKEQFQMKNVDPDIELYKEQVKKEILSEAKISGITADQYVNNGSVPPAGRTFTIYQMKHNEETKDFHFSSLQRFEEKGVIPSINMYEKVYEGTLKEGQDLNSIYAEFNINHPADFTGHSLSVSDIVVISYEGLHTANFVDSFGFQNIEQFAKEHEALLSAETMDSIKFDNDIDLDKEKTREQLGFKDQDAAAPKMSMKERFAAAQKESEKRAATGKESISKTKDLAAEKEM